MINREIQVYGVVLGVAMVLAFLAWKSDQAPKKPSSEKSTVELLKVQKDDLVSVTYKEKLRTTKLAYKGEGDKKWIWVERDEKKEIKPPPTPVPTPGKKEPAKADEKKPDEKKSEEAKAEVSPSATPEATPTPEPQYEARNTAFTGGNTATLLMERFAPLTAARRLGKVDEDTLKQFDLDEPEIEVTVETSRKTYVIHIGATAPGGSAYYVKNDDGEVYLVNQAAIKPALGADATLMQKTVHQLSDKDVVAAVVSKGKREVKFNQQNRHDARQRFWTREGSPDNQKDSQFETWMGKARRLPVMGYPTEQPKDATPAMRISYKKEGGDEIAFLEILPAKDGGKPLVRSDQTHVWAESHPNRVDEVLSELDAVLGGSG